MHRTQYTVIVITILLMFSVISANAAVDRNTVAVWLFEEGDGDTVRDASGNGTMVKEPANSIGYKQNLEQ